ncbi:putative disease resistance RPP13-like protein 1 [Silene latifolia]|uniref:putative disease resistance RPP13-like protein 1 n=1 Tax=Silene latifolia TaxID=37657 RepID=UPI003D771B37
MGGAGEAYLSRKQQLSGIGFDIEFAETCLRLDFEEDLLGKLCPHSNLKLLMLKGYNCVRMPSWGIGDKLCTFLPNLFYLQISNCQRLQSLPRLGKLCRLKTLYVDNLPNVEYMEDTADLASNSAGSPGVNELPFFPCLETLKVEDLPKLKRWWSGSPSSPLFSHLRRFEMLQCPEMTSIPVCPVIEHMVIRDNKRSLELRLIDDVSSPSSQKWELTTANLGSLKLMPLEYTQLPTRMIIIEDKEVESLSQVRELFQNGFLSNVTAISVFRCPKIKSLFGGIEHLSALTRLSIQYCLNLLSVKKAEADEEKEKGGIPWQYLSRTLCSLTLSDDAMENLSEGVQYLTSLKTLELLCCKQLKTLPKWMPKLTSLECLAIKHCSDQLKERCYQPAGEDWRLIHHIPKVVLL